MGSPSTVAAFRQRPSNEGRQYHDPARNRQVSPVFMDRPVLHAFVRELAEQERLTEFAEALPARDAAEAAAWFLGEEQVGFMPSRGVRWESGLEPPPHLVGERARALDVLARGGLVCASASALAEPLPPRPARPEPLELSAGSALGLDAI